MTLKCVFLSVRNAHFGSLYLWGMRSFENKNQISQQSRIVLLRCTIAHQNNHQMASGRSIVNGILLDEWFRYEFHRKNNNFTSQNRCVITSMIWLIPLTVVTVWTPTLSRIKFVASEIGVDLTFWISLRQFADERYEFVVTVDFVYGCHSQSEFLRRGNCVVLIYVSFRITPMNFDFLRSSVSPILVNQSFSWQSTTVDSQTNWIERIQFTDNRCHSKHRIHIS